MKQAAKYVVALDQGTTSSRAIVFNRDAEIIGLAQREFTQYYPQPGWVEHDPMELWSSQSSVLTAVLAQHGIRADEIAALGITNQRETTVVWDKTTGRPIYNAIVWQCRRTAGICEELKARGLSDYVRETTGLVIDAYFAGTKIKWVLDHVDGARSKAEAGELLFGTVDTWLLWKLTEGRVHVTDYTNASRTLLFNINTLEWDTRMLQELGVPASMLPKVEPSSKVYAEVQLGGEGGASVPVAGIAGDQQSALFGQLCVEPGLAKNTYGTGCFLLMNTGSTKHTSQHGLVTTLAIGAQCEVNYALEGSVFMGGATVQWLRDELGVVRDAADTDYFASKVEDMDGIYLVPAFVGMGAPYWDPHASGLLIGLSRGTGRNHIIRAGLESIAYQSRDLIDAMQEDSGIQMSSLRVDGGAVANDFLMQFQADITGRQVVRPKVVETTALGAALLAGLAVGFWTSTAEVQAQFEVDRTFEPMLPAADREKRYAGWRQAVERALGWKRS